MWSALALCKSNAVETRIAALLDPLDHVMVVVVVVIVMMIR